MQYIAKNEEGMTVGELISFLKDMDKDSVVLFWGYDKQGYMPLGAALVLDQPIIYKTTGEIVQKDSILLE